MSGVVDVLFVSHGGGPMPLLGDAGHSEMVTRLQEVAAELQKPSAILVISAHWEEPVATLTAAANPELIYDYYGFPPEAYDIQYPCAGEPKLAERVHLKLQQAGVPAKLDDKRGFDHGLFVPLKLMYPEADIPCVQLSLLDNLNAQAHVAMGHALRSLDFGRLLIIGSGFSFHNMQAFFATETEEHREQSHAFQDWLADTCVNTEIDEQERYRRLVNWQDAPHARFSHPREEHLLPLHVCYGVAGRACDSHSEVTILGKPASILYWRGVA